MVQVSCVRGFVRVASLMLLGVVVGGCIEEGPEPSADELDLLDESDVEAAEADPAGWFGDEMWDEGPPADEREPAFDERHGQVNLALAPGFQLPFPCDQVWAGQTRSDHSPVNSVDFNRANDVDDTVVAAFAGEVTRVANEGNVSYGRWVEIDHGGGYRTRYAHLNTQSVSVGQSVAQGKKIGTVGSTGGSSGPHLHYELRLNGTAIKPVFNGSTALFYGTKNYTSKNSCGGGGGGGVSGTVSTAGPALTVRSTASTAGTAVGSVANGAKVTISCQKLGTSVTGTFGTTKLWDFIGDGYVSDAYVSTGADGQVAPTCK